MTIVLPTSLKYCCYTTLWNAEVVVWPFTAINSHWVLWVAHALGSENHCETTKSFQICFFFNSESIIPRSRMSTNWNDALSASGLLWVTRLLAVLLKSGVSIYVLAFALEVDILSTGLNKDCVMWHIRPWLFWETITITVSHVCCYSVNHSNAQIITALTAQSDTSNFPR